MNASHKILYLVANTRHTPSNDTVIEYHFQWDLVPVVNHTCCVGYQPVCNPITSVYQHRLGRSMTVQLRLPCVQDDDNDDTEVDLPPLDF